MICGIFATAYQSNFMMMDKLTFLIIYNVNELQFPIISIIMSHTIKKRRQKEGGGEGGRSVEKGDKTNIKQME